MIYIGLLSLSLLIASDTVSAATASTAQWQALNSSVSGRLGQGTPISLPCFTEYNGLDVSKEQSACATIEANSTDPMFRSGIFGAFMQPQWETCQNTDQGCLTNTGVSNATCLQGSVAPYYIDVATASDVQYAFNFSKTTGVPLSIKNSGHDFKGRSSIKGSLALWTRHLDSMTFNASFTPHGCSARSATYRTLTYGAGVPFEDAYQFAEENNSTLIGGYASSVGAAGGWILGGGHSVLSPVYGLGVDRVVQFTVVTPDGQLRIANSCQNEDLFFALRGGGPGTFGVVLDVTYSVEPRVSLQVVSMSLNGNSMTARRFYEIVVNNTAKWASEGWGGHITNMGNLGMIYVNPLLSNAEAKTSMEPIMEFVQANGGTVSTAEVASYWQFFQQFLVSAQAPVGQEMVMGSRLIGKDVFTNPNSSAQLVDILVGIFDSPVEAYIPVTPPALYNATEATSVTPGWRESYWHFAGASAWLPNSTQADITTAYSLVHNLTETLTELSPNTGAYMSEGDVYQSDWETAYWGEENYERLLTIKKKYDPSGLLTCWQCVGWSGPSDPTSTCYLPAPN